jgi:hypothetical protein
MIYITWWRFFFVDMSKEWTHFTFLIPGMTFA